MYKIKFNFKNVREELGMTQTELARMAGLSQSHISELELFQESPTLATIAIICSALKKHPFELLEVE